MKGAEERAVALPTGTVTFLMSDVEGSTRCWEEVPEGMAVAVSRHYELLDGAIGSHGGVRPLEQGEGDSVVGAFSRASDATAAAIAAQQALAVEPWPDGAELRVRIAVHTGEAQLRDEGNYVGQTLNRGARLRAIGYGGQVLLSAATAALVADRLPSGAVLVDLGLHRLKDLGRPEHVWQVGHPDLGSEFPPLRSLDAFHHNLPVQLTPLVGRRDETAEVGGLLVGERLVTLTGSAGVGKTRLALAVAAESLDSHPGGVWWVELAPLGDRGAVGRAILAAVGGRERPGSSVPAQLSIALGDLPALLVLDNCEHLIADCADLVAGLLATHPSATVLATSREPLGVPGEIIYRVPSLRCPSSGQAIDVPTLSQYDAVALFVERAHRARPSFMVSDLNAAAVAQICHRLDGIPLALELAAARCRQMSAERITIELDDRFRLLTGGSRTVMARHQTLAASVDWSFDLLDDTEQITFRRLGAFVGPFPLEAAEAVVAAGGDVVLGEVFDVVSRLVDKSVVAVDESPRGEPRYRLLETLRAYAVDRTRAAGELSMVRAAHATWWADWLEPRGVMPTDDILDEIEEYWDNISAALDCSIDTPALGLRLLRNVTRAWAGLARVGDAVASADRLLTLDNAERYPAEWLPAATSSAHLHLLARGPAECVALLNRVEDVARELGDDYHLAAARWFHSADPADGILVRELARQRGDRYVEAVTTILLAFDLADDDPAAAASQLLHADTVAISSGSPHLHDSARLAQAYVRQAHGDLARSISLARDILNSRSATRNADAVRVLGFAALMMRDNDALRFAVEEGDKALRTTPGAARVVDAVRHWLRLLEGRPSGVDQILRDADTSWPTKTGTLWLAGREAIDAGAGDAAVAGVRALVRSVPHGQAVLAAVEAAATGDEDRWHDALSIALDQDLRLIAVDALEGLATAAARAEAWAEGLRLVTAAERLRDDTNYRWRFGSEQQLQAATACRLPRRPRS